MSKISEVVGDGARRLASVLGQFLEHDAAFVRRSSGEITRHVRTVEGKDIELKQSIERDRELVRTEPNGAPGPAGPDLSAVPNVDDLLRVRTLDNAWLRRQLSGLEQQYGNYRLRLSDAAYFGPKGSGGPAVTGFRFNGEIIDGSGRRVGRLERHIYTEQGQTVAFNAHMWLEESARGQGFSKSFTAAINGYYRRSGVDRITIFAVQDGSVAWARAGFGFDRNPEKLARAVSSIKERAAAMYSDCSPADRKQLRAVMKRFKGSDQRFPTPLELVELTGDDPELGLKLMKGTSWHGVRKLAA